LLKAPGRDAITVALVSGYGAEFVSTGAGLDFVEEGGFALIL